METWGDNHEKMWKVEVKWLWNDPEKWILPAEVVICVASEPVIQTFTSEDETIKCGDTMVEHGRTMTMMYYDKVWQWLSWPLPGQ